jgi:hypothetical protein
MPLMTYSTTHFSMIPKLQLDYLNKVYKQQAVRYDLFAKGLAGGGSYLARSGSTGASRGGRTAPSHVRNSTTSGDSNHRSLSPS